MKQLAQQHADWVVFDQDECWFSRCVAPGGAAWTAERVPRRVERDNRGVKALTCYGALRAGTQQVYLGFCDQHPTSEVTWEFLTGLLALARQKGWKVVVLIWDNAGWHLSTRLRAWIRAYNQQAKRTGDVRLLTWLLPRKSPWLNPIEPHWLHAKRATWEPNAVLSLPDLKGRLCTYFGVQPSSLPFQLCVPS